MSTLSDTLADLVRDSVADAEATRQDWLIALDEVFPVQALDPLEIHDEDTEYTLVWLIDHNGPSPAMAARDVWCQVFDRGPVQPGPDETCVFTVSTSPDRLVEIDLSDEQYADLFCRT